MFGPLALLLSTALAAPVEVRVMERGTATPLTGVVLTGHDAEPLTTPANGRLTVELDGATTLHFTHPDYLPASVSYAPDTSGTLRVYLEPVPAALEVVVESLRPTPHSAAHFVDAEVALETPGGLDDAVRLVQSLPGVTIQREYSPGQSELSVRGSRPGDNRFYVDGVEIPFLYHYNQYASVVPTSQLQQLELYPSTFGPAYGDAVGAIVEAETRSEAPTALEGSASANLVMAGADLRAPLGRGWWFSGAGRRSYLDARDNASLQYPIFPRFHDVFARIDRTQERSATSLRLWGAGDRYARAAGELDVLDPLEQRQTPVVDFQRRFQVLSGHHTWRRENSDGRLVVALLHHRHQADLPGAAGEQVDTWRPSSRLDMHGRWGQQLAWDAGYEVQFERTSAQIEPSERYGLAVAEEAPLSARGASVNDVLGRSGAAAYGGLHWTTGTLRWMPGARVHWDGGVNDVAIEPRLAARWRAGESTALKVGAGRYTQTPSSVDLLPEVGDAALPRTSSWQVSGGVEQTLMGRLELELLSYHKSLRDPVVYPIDSAPYALDAGRAWGVEGIARYRIRDVVFFRTWVGVGRSLLTQANGRSISSRADQPFSAGLVGSWTPSAWTFGVRIRVASGLPYTPLTGSLYDAGEDTWLPLAGPMNSERFPLYTKYDLRIARTWTYNRWSLTGSMELWFVPKGARQLYPTWSYDYSEQGFALGPPVLPLLSLQAKF